jgi:hypothetical protein
MVKHLPSKHEALTSNSSTAKKKKKREKERKKKKRFIFGSLFGRFQLYPLLWDYSEAAHYGGNMGVHRGAEPLISWPGNKRKEKAHPQ